MIIGRLYEIEERIAHAPVEKRTVARTTLSRPIFDEFRLWLLAKSASVLPQSALGRAVSYAVELLPRLEVYLTDCRVPIDNNRAENSIRPFAVGRKNWLFCDQDHGAGASAALYSIIESAKANALEPMHYLRFLLRCYRKFGPEAMPWEKLLPHPKLRSYAESIAFPGASNSPSLSIFLWVRGALTHLVPQERTTAALSDLFGAPISEGTLNSIIGHAHSRLESTSEAIQAALSAEAVVGLDETGSFYNGTRWWQHTVSSDQYTHYGFHPRRGLEGTEWSSPFLVQYCGITIHDAWAPYFQLPKAGHALCNAHHLRQLKGVFETTGQSWASRMQRLLRAVRDEVSEARDRGFSSLSETRRAYWIRRYRRIIGSGLKENPLREPPAGRARVRQSVARRLLEQLRDREKETLAFMSDFRIRFDNNQAERDLRMTKVKQKVSGCFRSVTGAKAFFRIRGYILTLQKQGADVFEYLIQVFTPGTPDVLLPQA